MADLFLDVEPKRVLVEEEYRFEQEVSENSEPVVAQAPHGRVEYAVRYEGDAFRRCGKLLEKRGGAGSGLLGHLALTDHEKTDLADSAGFHEASSSIPLRVPLERGAGADALADGRSEYRWGVDYHLESDTPSLVPLNLKIDVDDPDSAAADDESRKDWSLEEFFVLATEIMKTAAFEPGLTLSVTARAVADVPREVVVLNPVIRQMSVSLPHLTSLDPGSLKLEHRRGEKREALGGIQHDPAARCVEWFDVPLGHRHRERSPIDSNEVDRVRFWSEPMQLTIGQPGELLEDEELKVRAEVEFPGLLLSGMRLRRFDTAGQRVPASETFRTRSVVLIECAVILGDTFARRLFSPFQRLVFEEIVPDSKRVDDVESVLTYLGFFVETSRNLTSLAEDSSLLHILVARRSEGPTESTLTVVVRGRQAATHRRSQQGPDHQYSSRIDSGELTLYVRGWARGRTRATVEAMNELHRKVKERFRPLRSRR